MRPLRLLSYNVRYFGHGTGGIASTGASMQRIAKALAGLDPLPAIACFQEVETRSIRSLMSHRGAETQLERFMEVFATALAAAGKAVAYDAYYFPAHAYRLTARTRVYTTGLAILAREDVAIDHHNADVPYDITHRRLHVVRHLKQTRVCAHVRFRPREGPAGGIDVFNTHLSLPSTLAREFWTEPRRLGWGRNQLEEARNLARFVEKERRSDRFVVMGDFNALPGSPVYRFLVEDRAWTDAFARCYRFSVPDLADWPTAGFFQLRMHLDHVFTGSGLEWVDFDETAPFGD